jgi:hypothetical protein
MNTDGYKNILRIVTVLALVGLLVLLADPFMAWMPEAGLMAILLVSAALVCVWAGLILHERAADEREEAHRSQAGRAAYLAGVAVLTIGMVVQGLAHDIDPWVPGALAAMVSAKLIARFYADNNR